MLFFIFIALFAISVLAVIHTDEMSGWHLLATIAVALTLIALFISTIGLASVYIGADATFGWVFITQMYTTTLNLSLYLKTLKASRKRGFIFLYIYCIINI